MVTIVGQRGRDQGGSGLVEVLVALFILSLAATAFLGLVAGAMQGFVRARQWQAAVTCAEQAIESVRAGLVKTGTGPATYPCDAPEFPRMMYKVTVTSAPEQDGSPAESGGNGGATDLSSLTVTVYPYEGAARPMYTVTTARSLAISGR